MRSAVVVRASTVTPSKARIQKPAFTARGIREPQQQIADQK